jgi:hypothetical protein
MGKDPTPVPVDHGLPDWDDDVPVDHDAEPPDAGCSPDPAIP